MVIGSTHNVLVCELVASADQSSATDQAICPPSGSQFFRAQTVSAYLIDPSHAAYLDAVAKPFDYAQATGFWGLAFTSVVGLYFTCRGIGALLDFIRRA